MYDFVFGKFGHGNNVEQIFIHSDDEILKTLANYLSMDIELYSSRIPEKKEKASWRHVRKKAASDVKSGSDESIFSFAERGRMSRVRGCRLWKRRRRRLVATFFFYRSLKFSASCARALIRRRSTSRAGLFLKGGWKSRRCCTVLILARDIYSTQFSLSVRSVG